MTILGSFINQISANVKLVETSHSDPSIVQMKVDLELLIEKEEKRKFKKLKIRENMAQDNNVIGMWNHVYFIRCGDKNVGFLSLSESSFYENLVWLTHLYIVEDYRNKNVGSKAIKLAKEIVAYRGFDYFGVRFEGDKRKRFYSKSGFASEMSCVSIAEL